VGQDLVLLVHQDRLLVYRQEIRGQTPSLRDVHLDDFISRSKLIRERGRESGRLHHDGVPQQAESGVEMQSARRKFDGQDGPSTWIEASSQGVHCGDIRPLPKTDYHVGLGNDDVSPFDQGIVLQPLPRNSAECLGGEICLGLSNIEPQVGPNAKIAYAETHIAGEHLIGEDCDRFDLENFHSMLDEGSAESPMLPLKNLSAGGRAGIARLLKKIDRLARREATWRTDGDMGKTGKLIKKVGMGYGSL
jgi:hypothetical protein